MLPRTSLFGIRIVYPMLLLFLLWLLFNPVWCCSEIKLANLLKMQDDKREDLLMSVINGKLENNFKFIKDRYFRVTSQPLVTGCRVTKQIGGRWSHSCGAVDGAKVVCMDSLLDSARSGNCLIYSFGIADDWSFEDAMADLGCQVRAFDPTVVFPSQRSENVTFHQIAIADTTEKVLLASYSEIVQAMTLTDIMKMMGDEDKEITYLKVDVEGCEIKSLPQWLKSNAVRNVRQIGVEMHMKGYEKELSAGVYAKLIKTFQEYNRRGFKLTAFTPNWCMERLHDEDKKYYTYFDLLLVKQD